MFRLTWLKPILVGLRRSRRRQPGQQLSCLQSLLAYPRNLPPVLGRPSGRPNPSINGLIIQDCTTLGHTRLLEVASLAQLPAAADCAGLQSRGNRPGSISNPSSLRDPSVCFRDVGQAFILWVFARIPPHAASGRLRGWELGLASGWPVRSNLRQLRLWSEIDELQARLLGDASEHLGAELVLIVESELIIRVIRMDQQPVRAPLALHLPARPFQRREDSARLTGRPVAHRESRRKRQARRMPFHHERFGLQSPRSPTAPCC